MGLRRFYVGATYHSYPSFRAAPPLSSRHFYRRGQCAPPESRSKVRHRSTISFFVISMPFGVSVVKWERLDLYYVSFITHPNLPIGRKLLDASC